MRRRAGEEAALGKYSAFGLGKISHKTKNDKAEIGTNARR